MQLLCCCPESMDQLPGGPGPLPGSEKPPIINIRTQRGLPRPALRAAHGVMQEEVEETISQRTAGRDAKLRLNRLPHGPGPFKPPLPRVLISG